MSIWIRRIGCVALGLLACTAFGVEVTVNSTQPEVAGSNYQTVGAALSYVKTQAAPRVVRITGGGPYYQATGIEIDYSLTMYGDNYKPVLVCGPTATAGVSTSNQNNGVYIFVPTSAPADTHIDVTLRNLVVIPDKTNTPANHGIRSNTDSTGLSPTATMSVFLEDVVVTANDGNDAPVTLDGFTPSGAPAGIKRFGGRGLYFSGHLNDLATTGVICSWNRIDGAVYSSDDYAGRTTFNPVSIGPGCVFSYNGRNGLYLYSDGTPVEMHGTAQEPIWITRNAVPGVYDNKQGALGIWNDDNNRADCKLTMNHVYIVDNSEPGIYTGYTDGDASLPELAADSCFITNNAGSGIYISGDLPGGGTPAGASEFKRNWTFTNCTISRNALDTSQASMNSSGPLVVAANAFANTPTGTMTFRDSIIGGNGSVGPDNAINLQKPLALAIENSAVVLEGPHRLNIQVIALGAGVTAPTMTAVIYADPYFASFYNPKDPEYYGVDNTAYAGQASGGGDLSGAGPYLGRGLPTAVNAPWQLFE